MEGHESVYIKEDGENAKAGEIVSEGEKFYTAWGFDMWYITDEDIEQLKAGKMFYFDDGEYAHGIVYKEKDDD